MRMHNPMHPRGRARADRATVLLLGTDYKAGPWAAASLRRAGHRVVGAHTAGVLAGGRSRACPRPLRYPRAAAGSALVEWVHAAAARVGADAVLATTEDLVALLATAPRVLGGARVVGPDAEQYGALCDKGRLAATAAIEGVDHPRTLDADEAHAHLPVIVKGRASGEAVDLVGRALICHSARELADALARFRDAGGEPLVQELVVGRRRNVHGVARGDHALAFSTEVVREYPRARGITSLARAAALPPGLAADVDRLVGAARYSGPISVQVIERPDGRYAVHDVNLRLPASIGLTIRAGLDVPRIAVEDALGIPSEAPPREPRPVAYLSVDGEVRALRDALRGHGDESPGEVVRGVLRVARGRRPLLDPGPLDPFWLPWLAARSLRRRAAVRRPGRP